MPYKITVKFKYMTFKEKSLAVYHFIRAIFFNKSDDKWVGNAHSVDIEKFTEERSYYNETRK